MSRTDRELKKLCQEALDLVAKHGSASKAFQATGISERTLRDRCMRGQAMGLSPRVKGVPKASGTAVVAHREAEPAELLIADRKVRSAATEKKALDTKLKASETENEILRKRVEFYQGISAGERRHMKVPRYVNTGGQGVFCGVASDWHIEEDVSPESIPGYENLYNPEIAEARAKKFFQSYIFMLDAWRHVGKCDTAILAILGDIITGYIHEELMESNHLSPIRACDKAQDLIGGGIEYILSRGNLTKLIIPCCYGNHGRTTQKSRIHTGADNSFEFGMYLNMRRTWKDEKRIDWHIAEGYHQNIDLFAGSPGARRIRFHHGDAVKFGGGIGGITIPVRKKIQGWNEGNPNPADLDVFGHFHQLMDGGNFISNGSLIGYNAFALQIGAAFEAPRQACFWIDSERGKTMSGQLYVE